MDITFALCLPREGASVPIVRHLTKQGLLHLGVTDRCADDVELAITEACTNVLKHVRSEQDRYDVEVEINDTTCTIRVIDGGAGFDLSSAERMEPNLSESGRGIHLMSTLVDRLSFASADGGGTTVQLQKLLELEDDALLLQLRSKPAP